MNTARPFLCFGNSAEGERCNPPRVSLLCLENCENSTQSGWAISSSSATTSGNSTERERCNPPRILAF
ncbi:hypothetical protein RclHR1_12800004 [Rhizophagus clarus]|uniref:Uncharacterized protein n=1 Tax=Rhizophagus clarus TaxID=94130 RepID=A0A2Z6QCZ7_9GLOM|nr:hypothetical protein RclHR1_12800004 [Rhizophagus clarus]